LNYIWAGLIVCALVFALVTDVGDLRNQTYRNGAPLSVSIAYRKVEDVDAREAIVDVRIDPEIYAQHFDAKETVAATYPATLTKMRAGAMVKFAKDAPLPTRLAAMRDFADSKELTASAEITGPVSDRSVQANLTFPPVRFIKLRAITAAAIEMAGTAVELS